MGIVTFQTRSGLRWVFQVGLSVGLDLVVAIQAELIAARFKRGLRFVGVRLMADEAIFAEIGQMGRHTAADCDGVALGGGAALLVERILSAPSGRLGKGVAHEQQSGDQPQPQMANKPRGCERRNVSIHSRVGIDGIVFAGFNQSGPPDPQIF